MPVVRSRGKIRTLVHLAQSHTYGPLAVPEDKDTLTVEENVRHLERIVGTLEWLHSSVQEHSRPWCFVLIDTLHLTHCVRPGLVGWQDVADIGVMPSGCAGMRIALFRSLAWQHLGARYSAKNQRSVHSRIREEVRFHERREAQLFRAGAANAGELIFGFCHAQGRIE